MIRPWGTLVLANGTQPFSVKISITSALSDEGLILWLNPHVMMRSFTCTQSFTVNGIPYLFIFSALFMFISAKKFNLPWWGSEQRCTKLPNFSSPFMDYNYFKDMLMIAGLDGRVAAI